MTAVVPSDSDWLGVSMMELAELMVDVSVLVGGPALGKRCEGVAQ